MEMTIDNVLEILEKHKLHIPSNVFYELKADIVNFEEPTTKNDLGVDREDAVVRLNALKHLIGYDKDSEIVKATQKSLDMAIKALEQEPRWIPVSERLPEKTGWYFITFKVYGGGYAASDLCYRKPENYWTREDISKKILDNDEVVAWMPLPKPYNAESEDT